MPPHRNRRRVGRPGVRLDGGPRAVVRWQTLPKLPRRSLVAPPNMQAHDASARGIFSQPDPGFVRLVANKNSTFRRSSPSAEARNPTAAQPCRRERDAVRALAATYRASQLRLTPVTRTMPRRLRRSSSSRSTMSRVCGETAFQAASGVNWRPHPWHRNRCLPLWTWPLLITASPPHFGHAGITHLLEFPKRLIIATLPKIHNLALNAMRACTLANLDNNKKASEVLTNVLRSAGDSSRVRIHAAQHIIGDCKMASQALDELTSISKNAKENQNLRAVTIQGLSYAAWQQQQRVDEICTTLLMIFERTAEPVKVRKAAAVAIRQVLLLPLDRRLDEEKLYHCFAIASVNEYEPVEIREVAGDICFCLEALHLNLKSDDSETSE